MLMLQRNQGQRLILQNSQGDEIIIVLEKAGKRWGKIGIAAPKDWKILREELTRNTDAKGAVPVCLPGVPNEGRNDTQAGFSDPVCLPEMRNPLAG